ACQPQFWDEVPPPLGPGAQLPAGEISLYLPSSMSGARTALDAAVAGWNSALSGPGLPHLTVVTNECDAFTPTCVKIGTAGLGGVCGLTRGNSSQGVWLDNVTLDIDAAWQLQGFAYTASGLQRTFSHEIGHLLGLWNFPCANVSDAVMQDQFICQQEV